MVLERLKRGVSSLVRAFTHEPFNQNFTNFKLLLLMTKWRSSSILTILTFTVQELCFLKYWKMAFPVMSLHLLMNHSTKAFQNLKCCYKMEVINKWYTLLCHPIDTVGWHIASPLFLILYYYYTYTYFVWQFSQSQWNQSQWKLTIIRNTKLFTIL